MGCGVWMSRTEDFRDEQSGLGGAWVDEAEGNNSKEDKGSVPPSAGGRGGSPAVCIRIKGPGFLNF